MLQTTRFRIVQGVLVAFAAALVLRAGFVQLWQGERWERLAARQHYARNALPAPRGEILDIAGVPLAQSEVRVRLNFAPGEMKDRRRLARDLRRLGLDAALVRRVTDPKRKWVELPRAFMPSDVAVVSVQPGVHTVPLVQRDYVPLDGLRRIVGRTNMQDIGQDGLELVLDSLLRGERGSVRPFRGSGGERYETLEAMSQPPRPGHSVTLSISYVFQDICDRALADAAERLHISGGDVVVLEPRSGEVRCVASWREGAKTTSSLALIAPFEPGSTLKPFLAARMVEMERAKMDEMIETFGGKYVECKRQLTDVHKADRLSLADVIRFSSNIGISRFAQRLSKRELYETLRDFGFGAPTGIAYPSESNGVLKEPRLWSCPSQTAIATGYEISVTAMQLAAAYGAIANDGLLLVPTLVKEIRDADGKLVYKHRPQVVRRVMQPKTARTLRDVLASVVDSGTATDASLATFDLGGKSGTARLYSNGRYQEGDYTSTFVGLFPARQPQYVVLVKLDRPRGAYYGGKTAAPVAKAILQAAIAARDASLDRGDLASQRAHYVSPGAALDAPAGRIVATGKVDDDSPDPAPRYALVDSTPAPPPARVTFDLRADTTKAPPREQVAVPDVRGMPMRVAARELHRAGLRVSFVNGVPFEVSPPPGSMVAGGSLVRVARR
ncbi:MAG TPA: penicillin-binding transpeptidase domain-containing protein [Thermoanaerobaculia bacterium]|nr:penicillin-binding transpeptidase domain-containing protein [Thermoanaerobaculia bacterium]